MAKRTMTDVDEVHRAHDLVDKLTADLAGLPAALDDAVNAGDESAYLLLKNRHVFLDRQLIPARRALLELEIAHLASQQAGLDDRTSAADADVGEYRTAVVVYKAALDRAIQVLGVLHSSGSTLHARLSAKQTELNDLNAKDPRK